MCSAEIKSTTRKCNYDADVKISLKPLWSEVQGTDPGGNRIVITSLGPTKGFKATTYIPTTANYPDNEYASSYAPSSKLILKIGGVVCEATAT